MKAFFCWIKSDNHRNIEVNDKTREDILVHKPGLINVQSGEQS